MASSKIGRLLLGRCVAPHPKLPLPKDASRIRIKQLELDPNLLKYYGRNSEVLAYDPSSKCKPGDVVLIRELPEKLTREITHELKSVVYPLGDITDPITQKKVVKSKYREQIEEVNEIYGENPNQFKYDEAPERGWQEERRDFSYREHYRKYHESGKPDPYAVPPD
ncbi:uncharacterized protein LOC136027987 [Artemia franciscana]|uniref:uncharacterized protein LOC136027987 n=1 Tax=Artemia franciscana TaxID=6661 RepID=UPI0032D9DAE4